MRSKGIDFLRANGASRANIEEFFDRLDHPKLAEVMPEDIWNVDEIGSIISLRDNPLVIGPADIRKVFTINPSNRE